MIQGGDVPSFCQLRHQRAYRAWTAMWQNVNPQSGGSEIGRFRREKKRGWKVPVAVTIISSQLCPTWKTEIWREGEKESRRE